MKSFLLALFALAAVVAMTSATYGYGYPSTGGSSSTGLYALIGMLFILMLLFNNNSSSSSGGVTIQAASTTTG